MAGKQIVIKYSSTDELQGEFETNLCHGGAFAREAEGFERGQECVLVLVHPKSGNKLSLSADVGLVVPEGENKGVGIAIKNFGEERKKRLENFVNTGVGDSEETNANVSVQERIRGLSSAQQQKLAHSRNLAERVALERMYGKFVWERLLRNASITIPEVARIARMGTIPRPLLEIIVSNGAWINTPHVRRSLLSNPRLTGEMINKIVRVMPKNELKLVKKQTSYSQAVRAAAGKFLKN